MRKDSRLPLAKIDNILATTEHEHNETEMDQISSSFLDIVDAPRLIKPNRSRLFVGMSADNDIQKTNMSLQSYLNARKRSDQENLNEDERKMEKLSSALPKLEIQKVNNYISTNETPKAPRGVGSYKAIRIVS